MAGKNLTEVIGLSVEDNARMVHGIMKTFNAPPIDLTDVKAVEQRINDYFAECAASGLRPGNLGMYASLGLSKQDVHDGIRGKSRRLSPAVIDSIQKGMRAMSSYRELLAEHGKLNPVTYIFQAKNFDNLADSQQLEISRADLMKPVTITAEEARAALVEMDTDLEAED